MSESIETICQQLGAAVELTMNPGVPMEQRHQVEFSINYFPVSILFLIPRHLINWRSSRRVLRMGLSADFI